MKHTTATILTITLTVGALTACTQQPDPTPTPSEPITTAIETTSTTPTPTQTSTRTESTASPEPTLGADQVAAQEIVSEFFIVLGDLRKDPEAPLQALADITTGDTQRVFLDEVVQFREQNAVQVGETTWVFTSVGEVTPRDAQKSVAVEVCTDSSDLDVVDQETGESILPADRPLTLLWEIEAVTENDRWKVGDATSVPTEECPND